MIYRIPTFEAGQIVFVSSRIPLHDGVTRFTFEPIFRGSVPPACAEVASSWKTYDLLMRNIPLFDNRGGPEWCNGFYRAHCRNGEWFADVREDMGSTADGASHQ